MRSINFALAAACLCAFTGLIAVPGNAATVQYLDTASWLAATNNDMLINFEGLGANSFQPKDYSNSTGLLVSGVNFLGYTALMAYSLQVVDPNYGGGAYNFNSGAGLRSPTYSNVTAAPLPYIHVVLPNNTTAISANLAAVNPNGLNYQVTLSDGSVFSVPTLARPNFGFFGITSDTPITYADFALLGTTGSPTYGLMDDFQFGQANADAPEACTMILIGSGLVFLNGLRKRQSRRSQEPTPRTIAGLWSFVRP